MGDALSDAFGKGEVDGEAFRFEAGDIAFVVLFLVGDDEIGAKLENARDIGVFCAAHDFDARDLGRGFNAVAGAADQAILNAQSNEGVGVAGHEGNNALGRPEPVVQAFSIIEGQLFEVSDPNTRSLLFRSLPTISKLSIAFTFAFLYLRSFTKALEPMMPISSPVNAAKTKQF